MPSSNSAALSSLPNDLLRPILALLDGFELVGLYSTGNRAFIVRMQQLVERFVLRVPLWWNFPCPSAVSLFPNLVDFEVTSTASVSADMPLVMQFSDITRLVPKTVRRICLGFENDCVPFLHYDPAGSREPEMMDIGAVFPNLTSLSLTSSFALRHSKVKFRPQLLPQSSLIELITASPIWINQEEVALLPRGLVSLNLGVNGVYKATEKFLLPPMLTTLHLECLHSDQQMSLLPRTLTHLSTALADFKPDWNFALLPNLKSFEIAATLGAWTEMMAASLPSTLQDLTLHFPLHPTIEIGGWKRLPNLKRLCIDGTLPIDHLEELLQRLPHTLEVLDLPERQTGMIRKESLGKLKAKMPIFFVGAHQFPNLYKNEAPPTAAELEALTKIPTRIEELITTATANYLPLSAFSCLKTLHLERHRISSSDWPLIGSIATLTALHAAVEPIDLWRLNDATFRLSSLVLDRISIGYISTLPGDGVEKPKRIYSASVDVKRLDFSKPSLSSLRSLDVNFIYPDLKSPAEQGGFSAKQSRDLPQEEAYLDVSSVSWLETLPVSLETLKMAILGDYSPLTTIQIPKRLMINRLKVKITSKLLLKFPPNLTSLCVGDFDAIDPLCLQSLSRRLVQLTIVADTSPLLNDDCLVQTLPKSLQALSLPSSPNFAALESVLDHFKKLTMFSANGKSLHANSGAMLQQALQRNSLFWCNQHH